MRHIVSNLMLFFTDKESYWTICKLAETLLMKNKMKRSMNHQKMMMKMKNYSTNHQEPHFFSCVTTLCQMVHAVSFVHASFSLTLMTFLPLARCAKMMNHPLPIHHVSGWYDGFYQQQQQHYLTPLLTSCWTLYLGTDWFPGRLLAGEFRLGTLMQYIWLLGGAARLRTFTLYSSWFCGWFGIRRTAFSFLFIILWIWAHAIKYGLETAK